MSERHIKRLFLPWQQVYFVVKKHQTFIIIMSTKMSPPLRDTNYFLDVFVDVVSRKNICRLHPASMPPLSCLPSASASDRKRPSTRRPLQACRAPITRQKTSLYIKLQTAKNLKNKKSHRLSQVLQFALLTFFHRLLLPTLSGLHTPHHSPPPHRSPFTPSLRKSAISSCNYHALRARLSKRLTSAAFSTVPPTIFLFGKRFPHPFPTHRSIYPPRAPSHCLLRPRPVLCR